VESAYLLQRIEPFDGLAILATNLRANLDDAFTRAGWTSWSTSMPEADHRRALWERCLGRSLGVDNVSAVRHNCGHEHRATTERS
jgi:hypothetical protein